MTARARPPSSLRRCGTYPLAEAARAHADMESRATTGKLLLIP
ncbi:MULTISPECIES: zinc-binding dehydrogenase [Cupriavidus]